ncbi:hypothetical protein AB835_12950 [Candidatus Endobugula sertula]|uniref:Peptidyl-prolyl cis-trans isomerase n=1 Tax=Candidatus Endobugula sertula TaxID=62101 RepID=A0A1D2QM75_9GAMM|nr:hypothetical protein AB835_12950 [Candidatus Endobugula sertula]
MKHLLKGLLLGFFSILVLTAQAASLPPVVTLETNKGDIVLELNVKDAPITTENFEEYVQSGFFDGLIFHRVIDGFMIQGGGFDSKMIQKNPRGPIRNESVNGLSNDRGTIAMARTNFPDSATSQFFINLNDNHNLNGAANKPGYAVFGKVIQGMDVVEKIAKVKTGRYGPHGDVPVEPIVIMKATLKKTEAVKSDKSTESKPVTDKK